MNVKTKELPKHYSPKTVEEIWYGSWLQSGIFHAKLDSGKNPFSMVIPPPNVTDILHLGHALNNTLQDILIRWKRMQGYEALWLPGIDHAGIATQVVIEKNLAKEGKTRQSVGREKFIKMAWEWQEKNGQTILNQLKKIGCSCDWERSRFTLDEGFSQAVAEVFVRLYNKGLIYRGNYIINWCPRCGTSISDEETEHQELEGKLWYIRYKLKSSDDFVTVATTRPETMLGDTALAVNPKDKRYKKLIGSSAILPILDRELKIIADDRVDINFGTGVVKVTPAHDPIDFEIATQHNLEKIVVINPDGTMNENAGKFKGMDRFECRKAILGELKKKKLLEKEEPYKYSIGHCYRCGTIVEPYLSEQWFVKMKPLAKPAIEAVKSGELRFYPEHWSKVYLHWMENIRDWCISRQLWWGHRIPVWYCQDCNQTIVSNKPPQECDKCKGKSLKQEEDVLDTWFSSWLWPLSTFGWPKETQDFKHFYPTKSLFTASEIIFLWVARMVMAGFEFTGKLPFNDVYIHGTVRDTNGVKMSKSLGNGIDPLDIIKEYGADALRASMMLVTPDGQDPCISVNTFDLGRNFANKLWNASKLVMLNCDGRKTDILASYKDLDLIDKWILSRLNRAIQEVTNLMQNYRFNSSIKVLYDFVWHDFCDWYLELIKPRLSQTGTTQTNLPDGAVAVYVLDNILRLLHPFIPFITEEIWYHLYAYPIDDTTKTIMRTEWPKKQSDLIKPELEDVVDKVQKVVYAIRNIRSEMNIPPTVEIKVILKVDNRELLSILRENQQHITTLGRVDSLEMGARIKKPSWAASAVIKDVEIFVPLEGVVDVEKERARLEKEIVRVADLLTKTNKKLSNEDFLKRAPGEIIEKEETKRGDYEKMIDKLNQNLERIMRW